MAEHELPKSFKDAIPSFIWGTVVFACGFEGVVKTAEGDYWTAVGCFVAAVAVATVLFMWGNTMAVIRGNTMQFLLLAVAAAGLILISAAVVGYVAYRPSGTTTVSSATPQTGTSATPPAATVTLAQGASLQLLMRPKQDPQELGKENIWRWYSFQMAQKDAATGQLSPLVTFIFITFDQPVATNYRRVVSPSNPTLHFNVRDLTQRSMVISIESEDVTGATIDVRVSASPI
ncbi:MAG: hypothetical protein ACHQK9_15815 [Reyranellales bacterium]